MEQTRFSTEPVRLPDEPVDRLSGPLKRFLHVEAASGILLLLVTSVALLLANSPFSNEFLNFWKTPVGFQFASFELIHSLKHWINDALMTIFFFVVGLEVKRELVLGELKDLRSAALPLIAAIGGMIVPAGLYLAFQAGEPGARGWGIPMATDIAFVVGCLALLGSRVPGGFRILLLSLAIADDIGAILVIAIGYTSNLNFAALLFGFLGIGGVVGLANIGVRSVPIYFIVGSLIWFAFHESGVHATIAGVILGLLTPARSWVSGEHLQAIVHRFAAYLQGEELNAVKKDRATLRSVELAARESMSPLERLETILHPWVSFFIMPLFAFANAGVPLGASNLWEPVTIAVLVGLVLGKPVGIWCFSWLAVRAGLAKLPQGVTFGLLAVGGILAGIGFTMAMFIADLALDEALLNTAKIGILFGSALCAGVGVLLLSWLLPKSPNLDKIAT
ncbi:MAG: Na+/H+ antiporter NhaA [Candidatus Binatia bacterium]